MNTVSSTCNLLSCFMAEFGRSHHGLSQQGPKARCVPLLGWWHPACPILCLVLFFEQHREGTQRAGVPSLTNAQSLTVWLTLGHLLKDSGGIFTVPRCWGGQQPGASVSVLQSHKADCPSSTCSLCSQVSATLEIR